MVEPIKLNFQKQKLLDDFHTFTLKKQKTWEEYKQLSERLIELNMIPKNISNFNTLDLVSTKALRVLSTGLPLRLPIYIWRDFGLNPEDKYAIEIGKLDYKIDWLSPKTLIILNKTLEMSGLSTSNTNKELAKKIIFLIKEYNLNSINILDLGSGLGETTIPIIVNLFNEKIKGKFTFTLADLNSNKFNIIEEIIKRKLIKLEDVESFKQYVNNNIITTFKEVDMNNIKEEYTYDLIVSNATLHYTNDVNSLLKNIYKALKPFGFFILGEWTHSLYLNYEKQIKTLELMYKITNNILDSHTIDLDTYTSPEKKIINFWLNLINQCLKKNVISPLRYFEGHISSYLWGYYARLNDFIPLELYFLDETLTSIHVFRKQF